nr:hypothetical protein [Embleya scabrispora]
MFNGLEDIDWASMEHAFGSAAEVPSLLRAMRSVNAEERKKAFDEFYGAVYHQNSVYEPTAASLPFLFEMACDTDTPDRAAVVQLIVGIGDDALSRLDGDYLDLPALEAAVAHMRRHADALVALTADPDPDVRRAAIPALGLFVDDDGGRRADALLHERLAAEDGHRLLVPLHRTPGRSLPRPAVRSQQPPHTRRRRVHHPRDLRDHPPDPRERPDLPGETRRLRPGLQHRRHLGEPLVRQTPSRAGRAGRAQRVRPAVHPRAMPHRHRLRRHTRPTRHLRLRHTLREPTRRPQPQPLPALPLHRGHPRVPHTAGMPTFDTSSIEPGNVSRRRLLRARTVSSGQSISRHNHGSTADSVLPAPVGTRNSAGRPSAAKRS